jgi:hypothetical protein
MAVKSLPIDLGIQGRPVAVFTLKNRTLSHLAEIVIKSVRAQGPDAAPRQQPFSLKKTNALMERISLEEKSGSARR